MCIRYNVILSYIHCPALSVSLDSLQVQGMEGDSVLVCANISGDIVLEIPVSAALTVYKADQSGKSCS